MTVVVVVVGGIPLPSSVTGCIFSGTNLTNTLNQAPTVEASRSIPQHLFWGPVGGGFEARLMPQRSKFFLGTVGACSQ